MCMIMGTDMANDNTMLVGYIDQDKPGVQEHFDSWEERKGMLVDAFAEKVAQAKHDGEPRLQHVTDVRVIATGGEGLFSGWQEERELR